MRSAPSNLFTRESQQLLNNPILGKPDQLRGLSLSETEVWASSLPLAEWHRLSMAIRLSPVSHRVRDDSVTKNQTITVVDGVCSILSQRGVRQDEQVYKSARSAFMLK